MEVRNKHNITKTKVPRCTCKTLEKNGRTKFTLLIKEDKHKIHNGDNPNKDVDQ